MHSRLKQQVEKQRASVRNRFLPTDFARVTNNRLTSHAKNSVGFRPTSPLGCSNSVGKGEMSELPVNGSTNGETHTEHKQTSEHATEQVSQA